METSRDLIGLLIEFSAGMEDREHDFKSTLAVLLHPVDRYPPAIVLNHKRTIAVDDDCDPAAVSGKGFINRVVYDLIDQMVQPAGIGAANIHCRALADRGESFEHGYMGCIVRFSQVKPPLKNEKDCAE